MEPLDGHPKVQPGPAQPPGPGGRPYPRSAKPPKCPGANSCLRVVAPLPWTPLCVLPGANSWSPQGLSHSSVDLTTSGDVIVESGTEQPKHCKPPPPKPKPPQWGVRKLFRLKIGKFKKNHDFRVTKRGSQIFDPQHTPQRRDLVTGGRARKAEEVCLLALPAGGGGGFKIGKIHEWGKFLRRGRTV